MHSNMFLASVLVLASTLPAQDPNQAGGFQSASAGIEQRLAASIEELARLREAIAAEKVPLNRDLRDAEAELSKARSDYQQTTRLLDGRTLDLSNLRTEIKARSDESSYLDNLLNEYARNFEARMHISELQRNEKVLERAKLAAENTQLAEAEVFAAKTDLLLASLERLEDALGGSRFEGTAVDPNGIVQKGTYLMVGPATLFRSADGTVIGPTEQRLGSLEPAVVPLRDPKNVEQAALSVLGIGGSFVFDPTQGNAQKIDDTQETLVEHILKGGAVMWPILAMAAAALLVALGKWLGLAMTPRVVQRQLDALLKAVASGDRAAATARAGDMRGPVGRMLTAGVEHMGEPAELVEEVMYEHGMAARLKLQRFLPFIAICASSAPLLGLLGTVTGIMNTFKLITVFGTGDVKTLSSGISEALITTEYGLIVAIPSLLLHAFLARKAKGIGDDMDKAAIAFLNELKRSAALRADRVVQSA
ncbi:MAG: Biopolymer transport protein ExbB [Planctomycetota bacterium]|jgi:biopolymer transport protein ExbB